MTGEFRQYLYPHDHPRLTEVRDLDAYAYRDVARTPGTFTGDLVAGWTPLYLNDFRGITENGTLREDVHGFEPARPGEEAPVAEMVRGGAGSVGVGRRRRPGPPHPCCRRRAVADLGQPGVHAVRHRAATGIPTAGSPGQRAGTGAGVAEPRGLRVGPHHDADQRLSRRGRRPGVRAQRVQLQHRALRDARPAGAVGMAALRPPLRGELPGCRGTDGALPGVPRRRTERDRPRPERRAALVDRTDRPGHRS